MTIDHVLRWLPLVVLLAMMAVSKLRAFAMQRRGQRVIVVDWDRPRTDVVYDTLLIVVFLVWFCLLVAEAWPFATSWLPGWLTTRIVAALPMRIVGALMVVAAPILLAAGQRSMGTSWRLGVDTMQPGPLVASGLFAWTRNPIYTAFDLVIVGSFLIHGRVAFLLLGACLVLLIHGIILREERFLAQHYGEEFCAYCLRVGRYGTFWRRKPA